MEENLAGRLLLARVNALRARRFAHGRGGEDGRGRHGITTAAWSQTRRGMVAMVRARRRSATSTNW